MTILTQKVDPHWNYFLAIEADLKDLSRYVEFDKDNFPCFSIELASILLAAASEVDVICKAVCKEINPQSTADSINLYRKEIIQRFRGIPDFQVLLPRFGLTLTPWDRWRKPKGVPLWWTAYNKVKHRRDTEYHQANLQNALNSVAGLFVIAIHLFEARGQLLDPLPSPQLLDVGAPHVVGRVFGGSGITYGL